MKTTIHKLGRAQAGQSILLVLIVSTFTFAILGGLFKWTFSNSSNNLRNNQYFRSSAAAEAATEKVITSLASDYQNDGEALVMAKLNAYRTLVPNKNESAVWGKYEFSDGEGNLGQTYVKDLPPAEFKVLNSQYARLKWVCDRVSNYLECARYQIALQHRQRRPAGYSGRDYPHFPVCHLLQPRS